jgi:hypothetical protein
MADLELEPAEPVVFDGVATFLDERLLGDERPADIGIVGFEALLGRPAEQSP